MEAWGDRANDLIARKLCKPPRSEYAKRLRHMFDVATRFGIDQNALQKERVEHD
jgi:hypothetical protein